jgi:hypothetical protein
MRAPAGFAVRLRFVALASLMLPTTVVGQTGLATVTGIVSEESGGAVPGLTVTNQATSIIYTGVANRAGNYIVTGVPIRVYVIDSISSAAACRKGKRQRLPPISRWTKPLRHPASIPG